jgi:hypothetical protein
MMACAPFISVNTSASAGVMLRRKTVVRESTWTLHSQVCIFFFFSAISDFGFGYCI